jgi:tetratricopeptide (TPR) repeat protein
MDGAILRYSQALEHLRAIRDEDLSKCTEEEKMQIGDTEVQTLSNIALCRIKQKKFQDAIQNCQEALRLDSANVKCIFRMVCCGWGWVVVRVTCDVACVMCRHLSMYMSVGKGTGDCSA